MNSTLDKLQGLKEAIDKLTEEELLKIFEECKIHVRIEPIVQKLDLHCKCCPGCIVYGGKCVGDK